MPRPLEAIFSATYLITTGTLIVNMSNLEGEEEFDPNLLGHCDQVSQERIADDECIILRVSTKPIVLTKTCQGCKTAKTASIILRGANTLMLEEMDRYM